MALWAQGQRPRPLSLCLTSGSGNPARPARARLQGPPGGTGPGVPCTIRTFLLAGWLPQNLPESPQGLGHPIKSSVDTCSVSDGCTAGGEPETPLGPSEPRGRRAEGNCPPASPPAPTQPPRGHHLMHVTERFTFTCVPATSRFQPAGQPSVTKTSHLQWEWGLLRSCASLPWGLQATFSR